MSNGRSRVASGMPAADAHHAGRRLFLAGSAAALGAGAFGLDGTLQAQVLPARTRIDVHHHFIPPFHVEAMMEPSRRLGPSPKWSAALSIEEMDRSGIATSVLSIAQPGVTLANTTLAERRTLLRKLNDFGARTVLDHPGRFGLFAALSPPDVDGSLKEIEYAFDTLKADGIGLLTSYDDKYLGDAAFQPVWAELNRRKAVIYVHPTTPDCCKGLVPGIPPGSIEYATDSTRTIAHIVFSGTADKFPDIRWIFSHSGGTLPFLTGRFVQQAKVQKQEFLKDGPLPAFAKFYYELAQGNTPGQLAALLKMVKVSQILYGTDYPFRGGAEVNAGIADWGYTPADIAAIERETAMKLLPRLKV